jgi:hypothetical protein
LKKSWINGIVIALTAVFVIAGSAIAYYRPSWPLLAYWLAIAILLGCYISTTKRINGIRRRARSLMVAFAVLIGFALATTQLAARRTITPTHLTYHGVHLADVDSFVIGAGRIDADIKLQTVSSSQTPWLLKVRRGAKDWELEALGGIEQLRVSPADDESENEYSVAHSAILQKEGEWAAIVDPAGVVVDTIRLTSEGLATSAGNNYILETANRSVARRYERRLRSGVSIAFLEGERKRPDVYERFVRVQVIPPRDVVNKVSTPLLQRLLPGSDRYLVSATPPYKLAGPRVAAAQLSVADSGLVELRNGDGVWRFVLVTSWRREPSADPGVSVMFRRNPRPMDTPLPVGVSCEPGAACGALSLRRLPPPVSHITLDHAGLAPERYGLLGTLRQTDAGYDVVLPRSTHHIARGGPPTAIPVADLAEPEARATRWVLLGAAGQGENRGMIAAIALGLGLLLYGIYRSVAAVSARLQSPIPLGQERAMMLGVTAVLCLLLTRVTLGARVEFFDPFLERGIDAAVGMYVAIAIVAVGLLAWPRWLPQLLVGARGLLSGQRSVSSARRQLVQFTRTQLVTDENRSAVIISSAVVVSSLVLLAIFTDAVWNGFVAGGVVLLAWVCVAWIAAFTGPHFETYDRGAHTVLEQLAPTGTTARQRFPEAPLLLGGILVELAHIFPRISIMAAIAMLVFAVITAVRRRQTMHGTMQPDYHAAAAGVALFMICVAALRLASQNGSMGAFVLIVFVALLSVRIGRSVGARLDAASTGATPISRQLAESLMLMLPLGLLLPLAWIDMGLFLVTMIPLGAATLLAVGRRTAGWRVVPLVGVMAVVLLLAMRVVFPSVQAIRDANSHAAKAEAFADMTTLYGARLPGFGTPMSRAAARSVATRDRTVAEELLIAAAPGPARDLLVPSIEQIWGAKSYANAGLWGEGLGRAVVGGRGVAETVSYAENTFAVFVLGEHGAIGGVLVLLLYLLLTGAVAVCVLYIASDTASYRASRALFVVAGLVVGFPAVYVALSNIGLVPITGQNMPFLGLNAWSDVAFCSGVVGILITGALRGLEEQR